MHNDSILFYGDYAKGSSSGQLLQTAAGEGLFMRQVAIEYAPGKKAFAVRNMNDEPAVGGQHAIMFRADHGRARPKRCCG